MANAFYTPAQAALVLANLAKEDALLSALVSRNFANDLMGGGKGGAPIAIKQPTTLVARTRGIDDVTTPIVLDSITEATETITLDKVHDYSAVALSEADLTLNITDFATQVLKPQAEAIVDALEHKVATKLQSVPLATDPALTAWDPTNPVKTFTAIRKYLRDNGVATAGLNMAVGTEVYAALLDASLITEVDKSGSTAALRDAQVGALRGFTVVESTRLEEDEILAFHRDAVTLVTRAPIVPQGASFGALVNEGGFSLRYLRDYDAMVTADRSLVSTFSGVALLPTYKVVRDHTLNTATVVKVPNGGIVHLKTAGV